MKTLNNTKSKEWLHEISEFLTEGNSQSTKSVTEFLGTENKRHKRNERGSKFLIPKNQNLSYVAINPDLERSDSDKPVTFLGFFGEKLNLKLHDLIELFPEFEVMNNIYDGGIQIFFHPVDNRFDFTAVACQVFTEYKTINELTNLKIDRVSFMFKSTKRKTRAGYTMIDQKL